jgi:hypothetical protein
MDDPGHAADLRTQSADAISIGVLPPQTGEAPWMAPIYRKNSRRKLLTHRSWMRLLSGK